MANFYFNQATTFYKLINPMAADVLNMAFEFAQKEIAPLNRKMDNQNHFEDHLWEKMGAQGLLGLTVPEAYGGMNAGYLVHAAATEAISHASGSVGLSYLAHSNLCVNQITLNGTEAQKSKFLPDLISGKKVGALAMSEPNAGSDVMSMTTKAVQTDNGFVLNGQKTWITNGGKADTLVVYANTSNEGDKPRLTTFIVEKGMKGFQRGAKIDKMGLRGSETYELFFDNCFIPAENVLGPVNKGAGVLMSGLEFERIILASSAIGIGQAALDTILPTTTEREQFNRRINHNQAVAHEIAQMSADLQAARNDLIMVAFMADQNKTELTGGMAATTFLKAAQTATDVTNRCITLGGGMGYTREMPLELYYRDAKLYEIGGGTTHIRKEVIARGIIPDYR